MAIAIVELLEPVDVQHDEAEAALLPPGAGEFAFQRIIEGSPIGEAGQAILARQRFETSIGFRQLLFDRLSRRNVAHRSDDADRRASRRILERPAARLGPDPAAVAVAMTGLDGRAIDAPTHEVLHDFSDALRILRMSQGPALLSDQLLRFESEQFATSGRDVEAREIEADFEHHVGAVFGEEPVTRLAFLEAPLRHDALLDVAADGV